MFCVIATIIITLEAILKSMNFILVAEPSKGLKPFEGFLSIVYVLNKIKTASKCMDKFFTSGKEPQCHIS